MTHTIPWTTEGFFQGGVAKSFFPGRGNSGEISVHQLQN